MRKKKKSRLIRVTSVRQIANVLAGARERLKKWNLRYDNAQLFCTWLHDWSISRTEGESRAFGTKSQRSESACQLFRLFEEERGEPDLTPGEFDRKPAKSGQDGANGVVGKWLWIWWSREDGCCEDWGRWEAMTKSSTSANPESTHLFVATSSQLPADWDSKVEI